MVVAHSFILFISASRFTAMLPAGLNVSHTTRLATVHCVPPPVELHASLPHHAVPLCDGTSLCCGYDWLIDWLPRM
jgi:hypothetical protein